MTLNQVVSIMCLAALSTSSWYGCKGGGDDPNDKGPACNLSNADLSYTKNIKRIIDANCLSCHGGNGPGPDNYSTYAGMKAHLEEGHFLEQVVIDKTMPQNVSMPQAQRDSINCWIKAGFPQ